MTGQKAPLRSVGRSARPGAMLDEGQHEAYVDAWLERSVQGLAPAAILRLFENAFDALWACTETTLGEVTLHAIAARVLHNASVTLPFLSCLKVEPGGGIECTELQARIGSVDAAELRDGVRFVLVEFLTVLGNLTAEILTPELHAALTEVVVPKAAGAEKNQP